MIRKNIKAVLVFLSVSLLISLVSCNPSKKFEEEETAQIQSYLSSNTNLNFVKKTSGLYYLEVQAGSGNVPVTHDTVYLKYTGKFIDGTVFETNVGTTDTLIRPVEPGWLIPGLTETITYLKVGGKALILIPSKLAYGASGQYAYGPYGYYLVIPGYTPLLFDLELVRIKAGPGI
jgi:FKBP-type peptidyl-prolyl cis-trans isomerase FkpA